MFHQSTKSMTDYAFGLGLCHKIFKAALILGENCLYKRLSRNKLYYLTLLLWMLSVHTRKQTGASNVTYGAGNR